MNWFIRFLLNLPARKQDINEIQRNFPELIGQPELIKELDFPFVIHHRDFVNKNFKEWLREAKNISDRIEPNKNYCQFSNCPLKDRANSVLSSSEYNGLLELMTIGGGKKGSKTPKDSFFDMVKKVFKDVGNVKKVILTDPYILADIGEEGIGGGHSNFIEYLEIIIQNVNIAFELNISPTLKIQSESMHENFKKLVSSKFPNATVKPYSSSYKFHDRLLIVKNDKGLFRGMFGPSFNGLNSDSIVLYGELDKKNTLDKIIKWFD